MSKRSKRMKISISPKEFHAKYNISSSIKLRFVEDSQVDLVVWSSGEGEMLLRKGYFETDLRLSLSPFQGNNNLP